jgi:hypothetical protein
VLAIAFLLRLISGLGGILIKALAALAVYVTHDFRYFHQSYLVKAEFKVRIPTESGTYSNIKPATSPSALPVGLWARRRTPIAS